MCDIKVKIISDDFKWKEVVSMIVSDGEVRILKDFIYDMMFDKVINKILDELERKNLPDIDWSIYEIEFNDNERIVW